MKKDECEKQLEQDVKFLTQLKFYDLPSEDEWLKLALDTQSAKMAE